MVQSLTPVQQRLWLHGLAVVHMQQDEPLKPVDWGMPGLQALITGVDARLWRNALGNLPTYAVYDKTPVISPSLTALERIRASAPARPLIWCQTPFAPSPRPEALKSLLRKSVTHPAPAEDDPRYPLLWLKDLARQRQIQWPSTRPHPRSRLLDALKRLNPEARYGLTHDGLITEEPSLFHPLRTLTRLDRHRRLTAEHEAWFDKVTPRMSGVVYVCAQNRRRLAWFGCDVRARLGADACLWHFPEQPDPRDPLKHFVLTSDAVLRTGRLRRDRLILHLDGDPQRHLSRIARRENQGVTRWLRTEPAWAFAKIPAVGGLLVFERNAVGWQSWRGEIGDLPDETEGLRRRLETLRALGI